jgi:hypothetical protein
MVFVDFNGFTQNEVVRALWAVSRTAAFFQGSGIPEPQLDSVPQNYVDKLLAQNDYIDYFLGRVIKCSFQNFPLLESTKFDRDNGANAMEKVRKSLII